MSPGFSCSANRRDPGRVQALSAKCSSKYIRIRRKKARTLRPQTRLAMPKLSLATNKTLGLRNNSRDVTKNQHEARITESVPDAAELTFGCIKSAITNTRIAVLGSADISSQTSGLFSDADPPSRQAASAKRNSAGAQKNWPRHPTPDTRHPTPDTRHPTPDTRHPTIVSLWRRVLPHRWPALSIRPCTWLPQVR